MKEGERTKIVAMYRRHNYRCFACGDAAWQRAHIVGNTKANRKRFGDDVIDSPFNWLPACGLYCNGLIDVGHASKLPEEIAEHIKSGNIVAIEESVRENIKRKRGKYASSN